MNEGQSDGEQDPQKTETQLAGQALYRELESLWGHPFVQKNVVAELGMALYMKDKPLAHRRYDAGGQMREVDIYKPGGDKADKAAWGVRLRGHPRSEPEGTDNIYYYYEVDEKGEVVAWRQVAHNKPEESTEQPVPVNPDSLTKLIENISIPVGPDGSPLSN